MIDLEKLDQLPRRESRKEYLTRKHKNMYNLQRFDHPWYVSDKADSTYFIKHLVLKKYLGRSFDDAFSEYCKRVPIFKQSDFLEEFTNRRWRRNANYLIDENGNIQFNPDGLIITFHKYKERYRNRPVTFVSADYKTQFIHKRTKQVVDRHDYFRYTYPENYIEVIVSGYKKEFESKKDPEYIRLKAEKRKQLKLLKKAEKRVKKEKAYCFLTSSEIEKIKLREESKLKIIKHGFTEESFKGEYYHGQKRKRE